MGSQVNFDSVKEWAESEKPWLNYYENDSFIANIGGVECRASVVEFVGGMGEGEQAHFVFEILGNFFVKEGYYLSHDGFYWDGDFYAAVPTRRTVIDYVRSN